MATILNSGTNSSRSTTAGERRFMRRLESHLEDDYLCWYDVPVGNLRRYPDFVIFHPFRGLLLLEVKDWKLDDIIEVDKEQVTHFFGGKRKKSANPLAQARQCLMQLVNRLNCDPQLIETDGPYQGKLVTPYGYGTVFTNITRRQLDNALTPEEQEQIFPPRLVITKDEMTESVDPMAFQEKLWGMFNFHFGKPLSLPQVDRIRWHVFPEIRITAKQTDLFEEQHPVDPKSDPMDIPALIRVMDIQQEQLARSLGEGHRVIHGVAGSGKTLILGFRCQQLAEVLAKPILVLCYNVSLASYLRNFIRSKQLESKVVVYHFHEWCGTQLKTYNILPPKTSSLPVFEQQVESVIESVRKGLIPRAQYGAIMIDEGHDFQPEWLELVTQMVDPSTDSLLLLYDDAQSIYKRNSGLNFSLSSVGIKAQGRTTILKLNYRNTREVLECAFQFAKSFLVPGKSNDDSIPLVEPESSGFSGKFPVFRSKSNILEECEYATQCIRRWIELGEQARDIAVIYLNGEHGKMVSRSLGKLQVDHLWMANKRYKQAYNPSSDKVTVLSAQSSKGLEFKKVILVGIGQLDDSEDHITSTSKLLYVSMTRAREHLLMLSSNKNHYARRIENIAKGLQSGSRAS